MAFSTQFEMISLVTLVELYFKRNKSRHLYTQPKHQNASESRFKMEKVITLTIPHIGEKILENFDTDGMIQCLWVSQTWKVLAENVLVKRHKVFETLS